MTLCKQNKWVLPTKKLKLKRLLFFFCLRHFLKSKTLIGGFPPAGHDKFALADCPSFREVSLSSHVIMINERQKRTPYYVYIYLGGRYGWKMRNQCLRLVFLFSFFLFFLLMHADYTIKEILCMIHVLFMYSVRIVYGTYNHFIKKNIKNESYSIIHTFKNYFVIMFSVFNKISGI